MKILHLTLKKKWFDLIACGDKKIEYREAKLYWQRRLIKSVGIAVIMHQFDEIHFKNGYHKNAPFMRVKHRYTDIKEVKFPDCHDKTLCFLIHLGEILEVCNWTNSINSGNKEFI